MSDLQLSDCAPSEQDVPLFTPATLRYLVEAVPAGALLVDENGVIQFINKELQQTLKYTASELNNQSLEMLLPERFRHGHGALTAAFFNNPVKRSMADGRSLHALCKDGAEIPIEIGLNPLITAQGTLVLATVVNISARVQANHMFRQIVDSVPYGLMVINPQGNIALVNPLICTIFGYSEQDLLSAPMDKLLPERYRKYHDALRAKYAQQPSMRLMGPGRDLTGLHKDGTEFPIEIGLSPFILDNQDMVLVALSDITPRKKMELDLRQTNSDLEEFTYVASHDLRSPLRGISDLLEWIREDFGESPAPSLLNNMERITIRVHRMETLIDNLLKYARAGRSQSEISLVSLDELLDNIQELQPLPDGFTLERQLDLPAIHTARVPLETALRNLIANAVQHHDQERGHIIVRSCSENSLCHISVTDDGPGIAEQARERIFKLFQTLSRSDKRGSGIGLAVTRRLVESHGGKITVEANQHQPGSTFHLWWPQFIRRDFNDNIPP
ncbi:PAS domain-containing sensor histidine kinase [Thalassomonas haliotis]|uniref:histidine kinase n=1 Tax=Thalassomonas haliotis TaxID=485448 RepID=A0ABY7VIL7_9GAMM|nr:PAS domain-containing sensor histidine kinase [Thalassomonas haliotis]WDE13363.1 PAS domain-containing sensor histidine kinase [Thalassomonas haliotis]